MTEAIPGEWSILVVEDEYILANDLCTALTAHGAVVVGPAATVAHGLALLDSGDPISGAILDVNLRGEEVFPLADELITRDIPFVFTTGYDASVMPPRFSEIGRCEKPVHATQVLSAIGLLVSR